VWQETTYYTGYSGDGAMQGGIDDGSNTGATATGPSLNYSVYFQITGTYYVFVRALGTGPLYTESNSVHIGLNGTLVTTSDPWGINSFNSTGYLWYSTRLGVPTTINIPTPGYYTINVWMREDGVVVDKLWLSTNSGAVSDGSTSVGPAESAPLAFQESGGSVVMEAENYTGRLPGQGAAAGASWSTTTTPAGYVGTAAVQTANSGVNTGLNQNGPALLYTAQFTTTGTYYVYVRAIGGDGSGGSDSLHVGVNRAPASAAGLGLTGFNNTAYTWYGLTNGVSTTINIPAAGLYTFYLAMREDGTVVDRIWLSTNPNAIAEGNTGNGPTASTQTTTTVQPQGGLLTNIAAGRPVTQSSTYPNAYNPIPEKAVDGNTDGNFANASVTHTNAELQPWWQVDLGSSVPIQTIELWNRTDCCGTRLSNFYVFVSDTPFASSTVTGTLAQAGVTNYFWSGAANAVTTTFPITRSARYVRVQLTSSGIALSLAEVRVLVPGSSIKTYYAAGGQRIAERVLANGTNTLYYLAGDHLGSTSVTTCGSGCGTAGALLARQLYYPFGSIRYITGTAVTDYGFTGQMLDDTGWMYYNARYYDPVLARFTSADTMVPGAGNPQNFNRYAYALSNPLKYSDPSGHCPAPAVDSGNVICIDLFIATSKILLGSGNGDGRGPDPDSALSESRGFAYIYLDDQGLMTGWEQHISTSCTVAGCVGPFPEYGSFNIAQGANGDITVDWTLVNGVAGAIRKADEVAKSYRDSDNPAERVAGFGAEIAIALGKAAVGLSGMDAPINGTLVLTVDQGAIYKVKSLERDPYPSLSFYQYDNGVMVKDFQRTEWPSGWPNVGLQPWVPRDTYP